MSYLPLIDPSYTVHAYKCCECGMLEHPPCPKSCPYCQQVKELKEAKARWIAKTVICPECNGIECEECNHQGRVLPEIAKYLQETQACSTCKGNKRMSWILGCELCDETGRVSKQS